MGQVFRKALPGFLLKQGAEIAGTETRNLANAFLRPEIENRDRLKQEFEAACDYCGRGTELVQCLIRLQREQLEAAGQRRHNDAIRPIRMAPQPAWNAISVSPHTPRSSRWKIVVVFSWITAMVAVEKQLDGTSIFNSAG